jgi:hypothetical protein
LDVLLLQLDGTGANLALMRLAAHHRSLGDRVELRRAFKLRQVERQLGDAFDRVYASAIFERTRPVAERLLRVYPGAIIGGTGWDLDVTLEGVGVPTRGPLDYSDYPAVRASVGFTQRGCRLRCQFCVVPRKEGRPVEWDSVWDIWRGDPWPRHVLLLDNDFFGVPSWRTRIEELRAGRFRVCFNQGINARMLTDEAAAAIASVDCRDDQFKDRRVYTAWDNLDDEDKLFRGLESLAKYGVKPDHVMVYVLIGYDHEADAPRSHLTPADFHRWRRLREFGARPYPMPFVRTPELVGFQRWIVGGAYDKRVPWADWERAGYEPRRLGGPAGPTLFPGEPEDQS